MYFMLQVFFWFLPLAGEGGSDLFVGVGRGITQTFPDYTRGFEERILSFLRDLVLEQWLGLSTRPVSRQKKSESTPPCQGRGAFNTSTTT